MNSRVPSKVPLQHPPPALCIHCKHYLPAPDKKKGQCEKKGTLDLIDGSIEYAYARDVRETECKGSWWVANDELLINPPHTQRDYFLYYK